MDIDVDKINMYALRKSLYNMYRVLLHAIIIDDNTIHIEHIIRDFDFWITKTLDQMKKYIL